MNILLYEYYIIYMNRWIIYKIYKIYKNKIKADSALRSFSAKTAAPLFPESVDRLGAEGRDSSLSHALSLTHTLTLSLSLSLLGDLFLLFLFRYTHNFNTSQYPLYPL